MILWLNIAITVILVAISFWKRNSKPLFIVLFIWMWFLYTFNYNNADYAMYADLYSGKMVRSIEPGMAFIFYISRTLGLPYHVFLGIFSAVGLGLVASIIKKFSKNISLVAALYCVFPFVFDAIQIRNFMAMALIIFGIGSLIEKKKYWWLKYLVINLIAISFHSFSAVCLVFIPINVMRQKQVSIAVGVLSVIGIVLALNRSLLVWLLSFVMSEDKVQAYFSSGRYTPGVSTIICSIAIIFVSLFLAWNLYRYKKFGKYDSKDTRFIEFILKVFTFCLIFVPLLGYSTMMMRFVRSMMILLLIGVTNYNHGQLIKKASSRLSVFFAHRAVMYTGLAALLFFWNYGFIFSIENQKLTYGAVFGNNILVEDVDNPRHEVK